MVKKATRRMPGVYGRFRGEKTMEEDVAGQRRVRGFGGGDMSLEGSLRQLPCAKRIMSL